MFPCLHADYSISVIFPQVEQPRLVSKFSFPRWTATLTMLIEY